MAMLKKIVQGLPYLLSHPRQLKHLIIRETLFRQRWRNKQKWVEWQKYTSSKHIYMLREHPDALSTSILNVKRIQIFSNIFSRLGNGLKVLDVGAGDGVISEPIGKMGNEVISIELPMIAVIAHRCGVSTVVAGDAEHLAFISKSFDVVIASEVLEHLWNPQNFFDEADRVLKAGGYLIIETPEGKGSLLYDDHKNYFTVERLKQLLGARFTLREVERLEATGCAQTPTIIVLLRKLAS
ncbi:MAG: class I SAM-dependent methyltransferase [Candidatus Bathyarchaeia archaeon]